MDPSAEDPPPPPAPPIAPDPRATATEAERAEVRRMIEAGASTPEDLRALAEKMRQQRLAEDRAWRDQVKPELMASKKFRLSALRSEVDDEPNEQRRFLIIAGVVVLAVTAVLTASSAPWLLIVLLLVALLAYAWVLGRRPAAEERSDAGVEPTEVPLDDPVDGTGAGPGDA
jgi:Flp pilus assembly protein TadB